MESRGVEIKFYNFLIPIFLSHFVLIDKLVTSFKQAVLNDLRDIGLKQNDFNLSFGPKITGQRFRNGHAKLLKFSIGIISFTYFGLTNSILVLDFNKST